MTFQKLNIDTTNLLAIAASQIVRCVLLRVDNVKDQCVIYFATQRHPCNRNVNGLIITSIAMMCICGRSQPPPTLDPTTIA